MGRRAAEARPSPSRRLVADPAHQAHGKPRGLPAKTRTPSPVPRHLSACCGARHVVGPSRERRELRRDHHSTTSSAFHSTWVRARPRRTILVGGDLELDAVVEAARGPAGQLDVPSSRPPRDGGRAVDLQPFEAEHALPGRQARRGSVRPARAPAPRRRPRRPMDWFDFYMGTTVLGGAFTARVNMNLREDKGWTYGARCGVCPRPSTVASSTAPPPCRPTPPARPSWS